MKRVCVLAAAIAVAWSVGVSAQGRNFSGQWTVDSDRTSAANAGGGGGGVMVGGGGGGMASRAQRLATDPPPAAAGSMVRSGGGTAVPMTIALDASTFTMTQGEMSTVYKLDGTPNISEGGARRSTSRAGWQGDKLVIQTTTETEAGTFSSSTSWYLEGESLVRETAATTSTGETSTRKTYYKRA